MTYSILSALASALHVAFIVGCCQALRYVKNSLIRDALTRITVEEFVCTLQLCVTSFELEVVREAYGIPGYAVGLFLTDLTYGVTFEGGTADMTELLENFCTVKIPALEFGLRSGVSLLAAALSSQASKVFWSFGLMPSHSSWVTSVDKCTTSMQVPLLLGTSLELFETLLYRLFQSTNYYNFVSGSAADTAITFIALMQAGGYFNPALALAMEINCSGLPNQDVVMVYVLGPAMGTLIAVMLTPRLLDTLRWLNGTSLPSRARIN